MNMNRNMITSAAQIVGGAYHIQVRCINGRISLEVSVFYGKHFMIRLSSGDVAPFQNIGKFLGKKIHKSKESLRDKNVVPNYYNDHSLWRYNAKTIQYLQGIVHRSNAGVEEYLAILASIQRGKTWRDSERKKKEVFQAA